LSLSPATVQLEPGVNACKDTLLMTNTPQTKTWHPRPPPARCHDALYYGYSPPRARPAPYQKVATATILSGSIFSVYSYFVVVAKVLLLP
jgi:hypothetical protein